MVRSPVHRSVWHGGWSGFAACQQLTSPNSSASLAWIAKSCLQVGRSGPGQLLTVRLKSPPITTSRPATTFLTSSSSLFTCFQYASPFDGAWTLKASSGSAIPACHDAPLISAPTTQPGKLGTATGFTEEVREKTALPQPFFSAISQAGLFPASGYFSGGRC